MKVPIPRPSTQKIKLAAIAVVAVLEISAVWYVMTYPPVYTGPTYSIPSTTTAVVTTSTTHAPPPRPNVLQVKSASIFNGTLMLDVNNKGPSSTVDMVVTNLCSPGFQQCVDYRVVAGKYYQSIFVLPSGREFTANFTGVCTFPISSCKRYYPVAASSYYLEVRFDFLTGSAVSLPIIATAQNTWAPKSPIMNLTTSLVSFIGNLSGRFNATIIPDSSISKVNYSLSVNTWRSIRAGYAAPLLTNMTGCGSGPFSDCMTPIAAITGYNLVQTALYPGLNVGVVVHNLNGTSTYFAMWDFVANGSPPRTTTTQTKS